MAKKIETIVIESSSELEAKVGDFAVKLEEGKIFFPERVYSHLTNNGEYRTVLELVSVYDAFPSSLDTVARELGWSRANVDGAYKKLLELVADYLPEDIFVRQPRRSYGAAIPSEWIGKTVKEIGELRNKS